jgi:hypothetical protein
LPIETGPNEQANRVETPPSTERLAKFGRLIFGSLVMRTSEKYTTETLKRVSKLGRGWYSCQDERST